MTDQKQTRVLSLALILILLLAFALLYQRQMRQPEPISATSFKLNTVVSISIYDSDDEALLTEAMALCDQYEAIFSRTREDSELYQLNHGTLPMENDSFVISPKLAELIEKGLAYGDLSGGAFDIAIEPVSSLWDFTSQEKKLPDEALLEEALPLVDYRDVTVKDTHLQFRQPGMGLDLGAIAKGCIADQIKEFLVSRGVGSAYINLGGNVLCIGDKPDGTPFRIGIQKPFADRSETIALLEISDRSVVSSGVYERSFEKDGVLYHHILNPEDGYPYQNGLISVTIISDQSVDGDGLSTSCFALGLEKGMELVNSLPDVQAVFITEDYELHFSDNFENEISVVNAQNQEQ
ncbi:MAG: FAD:protein FMN transferase [Clostridiales bacterium]|nr:FAD:protein FMN transferase [Clostridiales bacterium]